MTDADAAPSWFFIVAVWATRLLLRLFTRLRVTGRENVPPRGPLLVVCNHLSNVDPPLLAAVLPRPVFMMAKQELFRGPLGWMARQYGAFPVRRGEADREALRTALDHLQHGRALGMFPEGTRSRSGQLQRARAGVGLLAARAGCPVLPVAISGTSQLGKPCALVRRPRIEVRIGEPFTLPLTNGTDRPSAQDATDAIMRRLAALLPPEQRGVYQGALKDQATTRAEVGVATDHGR